MPGEQAIRRAQADVHVMTLLHDLDAQAIDAIARYIEALGGRLDLVASFGDHTLTVATTEAAWRRPRANACPSPSETAGQTLSHGSDWLPRI